MSADGTRKVAELLKDERLGFLTTTEPDGTLVSRPMALQEVEFDGDLWFFAERDSRKVAHIAARPQVNVTTGSGGTWVSLTGEAHVVDDPGKKRELWNGGVEAWLPQGPDDASVVLIKVDGRSAEYWDAAGGRLATALSFVKAKATGQRIDAGENERVDL
ncbi:pyridoxamine 5'-phosphate oxidase family protein [Geodermatophilus sp. URMC 65]